MYEHNLKNSKTGAKSDYIQFSPLVPIIKSENGELLEKIIYVNVISSSPVNLFSLEKKTKNFKNENKKFMIERMTKILFVSLHNNIDTLILGPFGVGVVNQQDPSLIAKWWKQLLTNQFSGCFKRIIFAVRDRSEEGKSITAFKKEFD